MIKKTLSPNEKAKLNKDSYAAYVSNLEATSTKFPINQFGEANISLIAEECGFRRGVLQNKDSFLGKQFRIDLERIGTDVNIQNNVKVKPVNTTSNVSKLQKELEISKAELEILRDKLTKAQAELYLLSQQKDEGIDRLDYLFETGRRVFL